MEGLSESQLAAASCFGLSMAVSLLPALWWRPSSPGKQIASSTFELPQNKIDEFLSRGVVVIPSILSEDEVESARAGLHECLRRHEVS